MASRAVAGIVVRCTVYGTMVHCRITGQRLGGMTGGAIQRVTAYTVNPFMTGGAGIVCIGVRRVMTRGLLAGRPGVACFTVIHNSIGTGMAISTIRGVDLGRRVMTLRDRHPARFIRGDMTTGTIQRDDVLVTRSTVGVCTRSRMVHRRAAVKTGNSCLRFMTGRTVERSRVDAGVAIRTGRTRGRSGLGVMVHRRAAILTRLSAMAGRTVKRGLGDVFNPLVTGAAIVTCSRLCRMVHRRAAVLADYLSGVTGFARVITRHKKSRIVRCISVAAETSERITAR